MLTNTFVYFSVQTLYFNTDPLKNSGTWVHHPDSDLIGLGCGLGPSGDSNVQPRLRTTALEEQILPELSPWPAA